MSEIEKLFFEVFGIEPKLDYFVSFTNHKTKIVRCFHFNKEELLYRYKNTKDKMKVLRVDFDYPQITDRMLLKLLSIQSYEKSYYTLSPFDNIDELKEDLLNEFIDGYTYDLYNDREDVKHQVQALFKENN